MSHTAGGVKLETNDSMRACSYSAGGMSSIGSGKRRWLNQPTHSKVATRLRRRCAVDQEEPRCCPRKVRFTFSKPFAVANRQVLRAARCDGSISWHRRAQQRLRAHQVQSGWSSRCSSARRRHSRKHFDHEGNQHWSHQVATYVKSAISGRRGISPCSRRKATWIDLPNLFAGSTSRTDPQLPADRLDPEATLVIVNVALHHSRRRLSSALAKYADAICRIAGSRWCG